jgi:sugar O-acyltransferase (sialic acid O-acetyltransferase NeuD family)
MKNLIFIGARGYGREAFHLATNCREYKAEFVIKGYLDDYSSALDNYSGYPPILGPVETYSIQKDDVFVCALGDVNFKMHYVNIIKEKGGIFIPLIHPTCTISPNVKFGEGFIGCSYVVISCDITIGDFVTVQSFSEIGHDVHIGDYCHLNTYTFLGGFVNIANFVTIHTGAKIIPRLIVGEHSIIGAGSVVTKNVPEKCTVFGNPAKLIYAER